MKRVVRAMALCFLMQCFLMAAAVSTSFAQESFSLRGINANLPAAVSLQEQVLTISQGEIKVSYLFRSHAKKPISRKIVLPSMRVSTDAVNFSEIASLKPSIGVSGTQVRPQRRIARWQDGRNIVPLLRRLGISDEELNETTGMIALTDRPRIKKSLERMGFELTCESDGQACFIGNEWQAIFSWRQIFRPGQTRIEITYLPHTDIGYMPPEMLVSFAPLLIDSRSPFFHGLRPTKRDGERAL